MSEFQDEHVPVRLVSSQTVFEGKVFDIQRDELTLAHSEQPIVREYMGHPGAVDVYKRQSVRLADSAQATSRWICADSSKSILRPSTMQMAHGLVGSLRLHAYVVMDT